MLSISSFTIIGQLVHGGIINTVRTDTHISLMALRKRGTIIVVTVMARFIFKLQLITLIGRSMPTSKKEKTFWKNYAEKS